MAMGTLELLLPVSIDYCWLRAALRRQAELHGEYRPIYSPQPTSPHRRRTKIGGHGQASRPATLSIGPRAHYALAGGRGWGGGH